MKELFTIVKRMVKLNGFTLNDLKQKPEKITNQTLLNVRAFMVLGDISADDVFPVKNKKCKFGRGECYTRYCDFGCPRHPEYVETP